MIRPTLILLCGIPGSGKSTYAKDYIARNENTIHLSSDAIRKELWGDESIQGNPAEVFALMQKQAVDALNDGKNVVYDATNITRKDRSGIISICPKFAKIECHIIWAPIETCIERDSIRGRTVGVEVIDRMLKRFQSPFYDEGIHEIKIIKPNVFDVFQYQERCYNDMKIPHDNPHHTLNVYEHCNEAAKYLAEQNVCDLHLIMAAGIHDVGKPRTKSFVDSKGNHCDIAHYYQHQCVSAYQSYGFSGATPEVAWLISTHMDIYLNTKYYKSLPRWLKEAVDKLHEADLAAH